MTKALRLTLARALLSEDIPYFSKRNARKFNVQRNYEQYEKGGGSVEKERCQGF